MSEQLEILSLAFDEKETAKCITLFDKRRRTVYKRHIKNLSYQIYYQLITQYLLSLNLNFEQIKKVIRRHIVLTIYLIETDKIKDKKIDAMYKLSGRYVSEFDKELAKDFIDLNFLLSSDNEDIYYYYPFEKLFYAKNDDVIDCIKKFNDEYKDEYIEKLLNNILDYFYYGCKFADIKNYNHTDLLIPHAFYDGKLDEFSFEVTDDYLDNYCSSVSFKKEISGEIKKKILGHIINIIFINNNLDFKKDMEIKPRYYYEIMFNMCDKKLLKDAYYFFEIDFTKQIAWIDASLIKKPFNFKYNGKEYTFSSEGIKEI